MPPSCATIYYPGPSGVVMVLLAPVFLWQRRRILNNAAKLLGPGSAAK